MGLKLNPNQRPRLRAQTLPGLRVREPTRDGEAGQNPSPDSPPPGKRRKEEVGRLGTYLRWAGGRVSANGMEPRAPGCSGRGSSSAASPSAAAARVESLGGEERRGFFGWWASASGSLVFSCCGEERGVVLIYRLPLPPGLLARPPVDRAYMGPFFPY